MRYKRRVLSSPKLKRQNRKKFLRRAVLGGLFAISIFMGMRTFFNFDFLAINSVNVVGAESASAGSIKSLVASELSGKWLGIIPRNNFLFMNSGKIIVTIQKSFPDIANVQTVLAGLGNLTIKISKRLPYAKWCSESDIVGDCLIIDNKGFAFKNAEQILSGTTTASTTSETILTIFTKAKPQSETTVFEQKKIDKLRQFIDAFKSADFNVIIVREEDSDYFFTLDNGVEIRIQGEDEPNNIIMKLSSIEADLQKDGNDIGKVNYIDLRYGNKVYLKMK